MNHPINGWLLLDKPKGITSAKAVAMVKKYCSVKKIGHAGTLDPMASGVLPLAIGEGTKVMRFAVAHEKTYQFTIKWGEESDTGDAEGKIITRSETRPEQTEIEAIFPKFTGTIMQQPPAYSAIKIGGKRAYALARAGEEVDIPAREITIHELTLLAHNPPFTTFRTRCSKGTYIRSLGSDIAKELGGHAHVTELIREKIGKFSLNDTILLDHLEKIVHSARLSEVILPVDSVLDDIPVLECSTEDAKKIKHGQRVLFLNQPNREIVRMYSSGDLIALGGMQNNLFKPTRVFNLT